MTIDLYISAFDKRQLDKITNATKLNNQPVAIMPTSIINSERPVFEIAMDNSYINANYLYCSTFDRYYYITEKRVNTAQRLELVCYVDVRQSFKNSIKETECTVIRSEAIATPTRIHDDKLPVNPTSKIVTSIVLPETTQTFDTDASYSYVLTVVGGEPNIVP